MQVKTKPRPRTAWRERVSVLADASGVQLDGLGELVEAEVSRVEGLLFTATPTEDLDEISRWQRLSDAAWCGQVRSIVAAWNRATETEREFLACEVSLALSITDVAAQDLVCSAWTRPAPPTRANGMPSPGARTGRAPSGR
ncbi:MAG TPA: hypothetical protein VM097_09830 [Mycobacteriales bacterium]|nr:hypothetical protein [Mycobacteriales bacterium]